MSGLIDSDLTVGGPNEVDFEGAPAPAAIWMALEGDFELELDFADRHRRQLAHADWLLLCRPDEIDEARRLFRPVAPEILDTPPGARTLRAFLARAVARRKAESLAARRHRQRIAERFSAWLGGIEVPGLLRALDPALGNLPLLVRGVPGSGRSLLCRYAELFRGGEGPLLRLHGRDPGDMETLAQRLGRAEGSEKPPIRSVWIDEIDALPIATQEQLAEWVLHDDAPTDDESLSGLRWIATAGPTGLRDRLEPALEHAFAPLVLEIPSLTDHPDRIAPFAEEVARDWNRSVGGVPRRFGPGAIRFLEACPWSGDRAELEAVLRTSLAASSRSTIEEEDLCFPAEPPREPADGPSGPDRSEADAPGNALESAFSDGMRREEEAHLGMAGLGQPIESVLPGTPADEADTALPVVEAEEESSRVDTEELEAAFFEEPPEARTAVAPDENTRLAETTFGVATESAPSPDPPPVPGPASTEKGEASVREPSVAIATTAGAPETPDAPTATPGRAEQRPSDGGLGWRRLARSLSHEIRNPLVSIRTFSELLPDHFDDETFRTRFTELVGRDVAHISDVLTRLSSLTERDEPAPERVDVSALLEELLDERRDRIARGRLLVLRELERDAPFAWADAHSLRIALAGLLDRTLESLPERGDLFVATRHLERGPDGRARLRILLRHHNPAGRASTSLADLDPESNVLETVLARTVVEASGGSMTIDTSDARETVVLIDLETPPPETGAD